MLEKTAKHISNARCCAILIYKASPTVDVPAVMFAGRGLQVHTRVVTAWNKCTGNAGQDAHQEGRVGVNFLVC